MNSEDVAWKHTAMLFYSHTVNDTWFIYFHAGLCCGNVAVLATTSHLKSSSRMEWSLVLIASQLSAH